MAFKKCFEIIKHMELDTNRRNKRNMKKMPKQAINSNVAKLMFKI